MSWQTLMAYFLLSRNGEESFNKFLSPDPDHFRGGPSYGDNISCVKIMSIGAIVTDPDIHIDRQTDTNALPSHSSTGARVKIFCPELQTAVSKCDAA